MRDPRKPIPVRPGQHWIPYLPSRYQVPAKQFLRRIDSGGPESTPHDRRVSDFRSWSSNPNSILWSSLCHAFSSSTVCLDGRRVCGGRQHGDDLRFAEQLANRGRRFAGIENTEQVEKPGPPTAPWRLSRLRFERRFRFSDVSIVDLLGRRLRYGPDGHLQSCRVRPS